MGIFRSLSLRQNLQSQTRPKETEPAHPKPYFEIPSDVDEPAESQQQINNLRLMHNPLTDHQMAHDSLLMIFPHPNGKKESKKCQHGLISR